MEGLGVNCRSKAPEYGFKGEFQVALGVCFALGVVVVFWP